MSREQLTGEQRRAIWKQMRVPTYAFVALLLCLAAIILLGALASSSHAASLIELGLMVVMVLTILLFSMEVVDEPPLMRFFAALGFAWVGALFTMIMVDYLTR